MNVLKILVVFSGLVFSVSASALCVNADHVTLRAKPSAKSKVSWTVGKNMPLLHAGRKEGPWIQVKDLEGEHHWIHARYLTHKVDCVIVRANTTNLRIGPGKQFAQTDLGTVKKYATFRKVGRDEDWIKVQDGFGQIHWTHESTVWEPRNYSRITF